MLSHEAPWEAYLVWRDAPPDGQWGASYVVAAGVLEERLGIGECQPQSHSSRLFRRRRCEPGLSYWLADPGRPGPHRRTDILGYPKTEKSHSDRKSLYEPTRFLDTSGAFRLR